MQKADLARLRAELEQETAQQLALLEEHGADPYGEEVKDLKVADDGFADSAHATGERSEALALIEASRFRLRQVDRALRAMDEGSYGTCENCGEAIPAARLEARPLSTRCVDCAAT